ncbi:MAG: class I tRNA ligase family protein, partial [Coriobacteriales bacterium]|nr:class I tRNA ligase family protein [Coriobacteriales bacterium]
MTQEQQEMHESQKSSESQPLHDSQKSSDKKTDYKNTMNLPQTDFAMRANLAQNEPIRLQKWQDSKLYEQILAKNASLEPRKTFILHDGPPYANGPIHMGHAFNKILKDIIVKYKSLCGYYAPYVPGWDCHGQPIEHMVETTLGKEKMAQTSQVELRHLCREWATRFVQIQGDGFKRLGVLGQWDAPYLTYLPQYEAGNVRVFKSMYESGAIYRGRKPIHWCHNCHTALSEAELEYSDETSSSIYVAFKINSQENQVLPICELPLHILIWTTTPWTLPANTGVTLAPDATYVAVLANDKAIILAKDLVDAVAEAVGWETVEFLKNSDAKTVWSAKGEELLNVTYEHPIHETMSGRIVTGSHVELTTGTGAVHTAPGHGHEDYQMGLAHDLPLLMPVDGNGVFDSGGGPFAGMHVNKANPQIIEWLDARGTLIGKKEITHSYPHCWRCHKPVIFRATD